MNTTDTTAKENRFQPASTTVFCSTTLKSKKPASIEKASGVFVDARFRGVPGTDFIDHAILSAVENFSDTSYIGVSYLARVLCQTRENISRKFTRLVAGGYLNRKKNSHSSVNYTLTDEANRLADAYDQERKDLYKITPEEAETPEPQGFNVPCDNKSQPCDNKSHHKYLINKPLVREEVKRAYTVRPR